jgi:uncharacterized membrane protein YfcA
MRLSHLLYIIGLLSGIGGFSFLAALFMGQLNDVPPVAIPISLVVAIFSGLFGRAASHGRFGPRWD